MNSPSTASSLRPCVFFWEGWGGRGGGGGGGGRILENVGQGLASGMPGAASQFLTAYKHVHWTLGLSIPGRPKNPSELVDY